MEKEILDRAFENGTLCYYREAWEEEEQFPQEEWEEEVRDFFFWEEKDREEEREEEKESWWDDIDEKWQDFYWDTVVRF
jgi:hypothetical protein